METEAREYTKGGRPKESILLSGIPKINVPRNLKQTTIIKNLLYPKFR